jgi:bacterioferritin
VLAARWRGTPNSTNVDGVPAQEIKESLAEDVQEELDHARQFADRIKELYGVVPGSEDFKPEQSFSSRRPSRPTSST